MEKNKAAAKAAWSAPKLRKLAVTDQILDALKLDPLQMAALTRHLGSEAA